MGETLVRQTRKGGLTVAVEEDIRTGLTVIATHPDGREKRIKVGNPDIGRKTMQGVTVQNWDDTDEAGKPFPAPEATQYTGPTCARTGCDAPLPDRRRRYCAEHRR